MWDLKTVADYLLLGERVLTDSTHIFEDHDNEAEAEELMAHCLEVETDDLDEDEKVPKRVGERYLSLVARRAGGEPFPFITGHIEFYGLELKVRKGAFVPRPSSELTVDRAVRRLRRKDKPVVADICTGAGPIALAIADELPRAEVWGADIAKDGLALGKENAKRLDIDNVRFTVSDMYSGLPERLRNRIDLVTGHVPYVPLEEIEDLPAEVKEHEPLYTLSDQSEDGLGLMRRAIFEASDWLKPGGWLLLEVSEDLGGTLRRMVRKTGLQDKGVASDEDELSVVVEAQKPR
jgi:release factor glutamine methyltransferase